MAPGNEGMQFFPLVFSLFMFILVANLFGMFPYFFTITSHIIVTFALAMLVIGTVVVYGFYKNGLGFLKLFVPSGIPGALIPLVVLIEVISFLSRPISLSVRLFANMLAGHITLKVFAGFVVSLGAMGAVGIGGAILPLAHDRCTYRPRISRCIPAGICFCRVDLHVSQRCTSSVSLMAVGKNNPKLSTSSSKPQGVHSWKQKQQNTSAQVSHALAWAVQASALATSSAIILPVLFATRQPLMASSVA